MMLWLALLGSPAVAADAGPAPPLVLAAEESGEPAPVPRRPSDLEWQHSRLQKARGLRDTGLVLTIAGTVATAGGLALIFADGDLFSTGPLGAAGGVLGIVGIGSMMAGPPVLNAAGYTARRVLRDLGDRRGHAVDVVSWVAYGATLSPAAALTYPLAAATGWAHANLMIREAERALYQQGPSPGPRVQIQVAPTWHAQTRGAGLRVEVAF